MLFKWAIPIARFFHLEDVENEILDNTPGRTRNIVYGSRSGGMGYLVVFNTSDQVEECQRFVRTRADQPGFWQVAVEVQSLHEATEVVRRMAEKYGSDLSKRRLLGIPLPSAEGAEAKQDLGLDEKRSVWFWTTCVGTRTWFRRLRQG